MTFHTDKENKENISLLQASRLQEQLAYVAKQSTFYKQWFAAHHIDISTIKSPLDLQQIPPTTKSHLEDFNDDFICVDQKQIVDIATTSGTLGKPVSFVLTESDLERLAYNEATSLAMTGITSEHTIQLLTTIDKRFMAGLAYFLGARKLGASIVRVGAGVPEMQWDSILKFRPEYLIAVPSFLLKLIQYAEANGIDYKNSSVKSVVCIGESLRDAKMNYTILAKKIVEKWPLKLYNTYASTEMSTAFTECSAQQGGHEISQLIITEVLDDQDQVVGEGEVGELTVTTLGVEGMPLVRFKTGDMVQKFSTPCSCGRTTPRLGPVIGRKAQMIKYKGTTIYPPAMFDLLNDFNAVTNFVIELHTNEIGTDHVKVKIGAKAPSDVLMKRIQDRFRAKLRVLPEIEFKEIAEINQLQFPKMSRKPRVLIDYRKQ
ncbi:MAG: AMP-binding protein [Flavobacteriaceae bacterium]|nr:AMP-binding protein [Flavobacteriaceae bacterium]